jgi:hypothetical protein
VGPILDLEVSMKDSNKPGVSKLLRVLVAGGVALAGLAGTARAEEKPTSETANADKAGAKDKAKATEKADQAEKKEKTKKDAKAAEPEGGGVKGW